jgi:hypothetical protein
MSRHEHVLESLIHLWMMRQEHLEQTSSTSQTNEFEQGEILHIVGLS